MLKKHSIIILLTFAYSIVLAHGIVPHHHHHDDHQTEQSAQHHHNDHEDDNHDDHDSGLAHGFENYIHSGSTGDIHQQPSINISFDQFNTKYFIALFDFFIKPFESPPPLVWRSSDHIPLSQYSLSPKGLRAPPCVLV